MDQGPAGRRRIRVCGTVQGVGFRPFVYRQAVGLGLTGWVLNDSEGVLIEIEGAEGLLDEMESQLRSSPPPLARVTAMVTTRVAPDGDPRFRIRESPAGGLADAPVSPDMATCDACVAELFDPADRRYLYPFINCTDCGPRYTITLGVPYDRPLTTMAGFRMCGECQREYDDPADRRFHAQPNACPQCGPSLVWSAAPDATARRDGREPGCGATEPERGAAALAATVRALDEGKVVAVKGIGGYHLAADAGHEGAIANLRRRKARDDKPFAVMVASVEQAETLCHVDPAGRLLLGSPSRPIVLLPRRAGGPVAATVAPGLVELGLMLAYAPLHHLLLRALGRPLVMTSGNLSDEPVAHEDGDAAGRLAPLVDGICAHDRPIHIRCDDSVARSRPGGGPQILRRSRGYAPEPLDLPAAARRPVLAVGAMLKNTVSVAKGSMVVASHHIGDLEHLATYQAFRQAVEHLPRLYGVTPEIVAHDRHPDYLSTKFAEDLAADSALETCPVQHHHAHIASCLIDHGRLGPVLGVAFDGLGYGPDATLWGGEFMAADLDGFERLGHIRVVPMPGGATAIREPWRMAVAWAEAAGGPPLAASVGRRLDPRWPSVLSVIQSGRAPRTSSAGRLFDAVAALIGIRNSVSYEGQAAIELEAVAAAAAGGSAAASLTYPVGIDTTSKPYVLDPRPLVAAVARDAAAGAVAGAVAAGFHRSLAGATASLAAELASSRGLDAVALTGGVFQNALFSALVADGLHARGVRVLTHRVVPPNDGGISIGQAAIAALGAR